jgi:hypothetical protein
MAEVVGSNAGWLIATAALRLKFLWMKDRWVHHIEVKGPGEWTDVAHPLESDPGRDDPRRVVSPTYQQIELPGGSDPPTVMLLGQFGPHHFSAVFAIREAARWSEVHVDVADRCRAPVEVLASTYLLSLPAGTLVDAAADRIEWAIDPPQAATLRLEAGRGVLLSLAESGRQGMTAQAHTRVDAKQNTHRLTYSWILLH